MLTPIDIQNHTLKTSVSGYNKKDTEEFLASILDSYETLFKENRTLKEKITSLSEGIQYYKQMENTLQKALILAEKTSTETQEAAKEEADKIIKDAKEKADSIKAEAEAAAKESEEKAGKVIEDAQDKAVSVTKKAEEEAEIATRKSKEEAERVIKEAEEKAENIISKARKQAEDIKEQAQNELDGIRINAIKLVQDYNKYCNQVRKFATAQLALVESEEYKLHVTRFNIDNNENSNNINTIKEEQKDTQEEIPENYNNNIENNNIENNNTENNNIAYNNTDNNLEEKTEKEENHKSHKENKKDKEKFSWNSDNNGYAAAKEPETPFTFIDPD